MSTVTRTKQKPVLVQIGKRQTISSGRWNYNFVAEYIINDKKNSRWIDTGELGKLIFGYKSSITRHKVRHRIPQLKQIMALHYNRLLVVEYAGSHGGATAVKVYDEKSDSDRQAMHLMIKRMGEQKDKMLDYYQRITGMYQATQ